ncbi:MAG: efflux RND transporter periplasmic adaptor subunit [Aureliella sp.]
MTDPSNKIRLRHDKKYATALALMIGLSSIVSAEGQEAAATKSSTQIASINNAQLTLIENVSVASRDGGIVESVTIKEGDSVEAGKIIFQLDTALYQAEADARRVESAIADKERLNRVDLKYAEKSSAVNRQLLVRSQDAYDQYARSITKTEIDRLELELEKSILSADQARHDIFVNELGFDLSKEKLTLAELRLGYRNIRTPIAGVIAEVLAKEGEWVAEGQAVARVIDPSRLRVEVLVNQELIFRIQKGQRVLFENSFGDISSEGEVIFVSPEVNPFNETARIWAEIDNSELKLRPGFKGTLSFFSGDAAEADHSQAKSQL